MYVYIYTNEWSKPHQWFTQDSELKRATHSLLFFCNNAGDASSLVTHHSSKTNPCYLHTNWGGCLYKDWSLHQRVSSPLKIHYSVFVVELQRFHTHLWGTQAISRLKRSSVLQSTVSITFSSLTKWLREASRHCRSLMSDGSITRIRSSATSTQQAVLELQVF